MIDVLESEPNNAAIERINTSLENMKTAFSGNSELYGAMKAVAEKCYTKGASQNSHQQNALLTLCRDILEKI